MEEFLAAEAAQEAQEALAEAQPEAEAEPEPEPEAEEAGFVPPPNSIVVVYETGW